MTSSATKLIQLKHRKQFYFALVWKHFTYKTLSDQNLSQSDRNSVMTKCWIHLTGAVTNPLIRFEYDDSLIKFEIGTNYLVQFYFTFLLHILLFLTLSIFSGQNLFHLRLHLKNQLLTPNFNFTSISNFKFNFKIQF